MELDRGILLSHGEDGEGRPSIGGFCHPGQELRKTSVHQRGNLIRQHRFQRQTPAVCFVILPREFTRSVAGKRAAV